MENLVLTHVQAFNDGAGLARTVLYDNMKSVLLELCGHYCFAARPSRPARGYESHRFFCDLQLSLSESIGSVLAALCAGM